MNRRDLLFAVLGAFFLTNAILAEVIGGKLIYVGSPNWKLIFPGGFELGPFVMSVGVIPWPVVFLTTDIINEYFGRRGVRRLTFLAAGMIAYAFIVLAFTRAVPAAPEISPVDDGSFNRVLGQSQWIIIGSLTAFLIAQLIDVFIFHRFRQRTGKALIWLRATGSTVVSQLIDSIVVLYVGLAIPNAWTFKQFVNVAIPNYTVKLVIAILLTPLIYAGHWAVEAYLGKADAEALAEAAARDSAAAEDLEPSA